MIAGEEEEDEEEEVFENVRASMGVIAYERDSLRDSPEP